MTRGVDSPRCDGAVPTMRGAAGWCHFWLLTVALMAGISGCGVEEPAREPETGTSRMISPDLERGSVDGDRSAGAQSAEGIEVRTGTTSSGADATVPGNQGSGETVWAEGSDGLIAGLDGKLYEAYLPVTIESTQEALLKRGLYAGPVNGVLDRPTMQAIYAFQDASYGLQRCGVPTPRTRRLLEQGSHTS